MGSLELLVATFLTSVLSASPGGLVGMPPAEADQVTAQVAPEECLAYFSWAGVGEADPTSDNRTMQLLADPQVAQFMEQLPTIVHFLAEVGIDESGFDSSAAEFAPLLAELMLTRATAIYLSDIEVSGPHVAFEGGMIIRLVTDAHSLTQTLLQLQPLLTAFPDAEEITIDGNRCFQISLPDGTQLTWSLYGEYLLVGIGENQMAHILANLQTPPPAWYGQVQQSLPIEEQSMLGYVNIQAVVELAETLIEIPNVPAVIDSLGLRNVRHYAAVKGFNGEGVVTRTEIFCDGSPRGLLAVLDEDPLSVNDLEPIPSDATVAACCRLDLELLLETVRTLLEEIVPREVGQITEGIEEWHNSTGIDFYDDILASLGETWCLYVSPSENSNLMTGWIGTVQLRDPQHAQRTIDRLIAWLDSEAERAVPNEEEFFRRGPAAIRTIEFREHEIHFFDANSFFQPYYPCWCIVDDQLVFSLFAGNLKSYLRRDDQFLSLADDERIDELFAPHDGPTMLAIYDEQAIIKELYPWALFATQMGYSTLRVDVETLAPAMAGWNVGMLPSVSAINSHLDQRLAAFYPTGVGYEASLQETLPHGGNSISLVMWSVAALHSRVNEVRDKENSAVDCLENIERALNSYRREHGHYPPAYTTDEEGNPLLSWRVLILPHLGEEPLYDEFHLDEPWDSEHNASLIGQIPWNLEPSRGEDVEPGETLYQTIRVPEGLFPGAQPIANEDCTDGLAATILVVQTDLDHAVPWTAPQDYQPDAENPLEGLRMHSGGFYVAMGDGGDEESRHNGEVRLFRSNIERDDFDGLTSRAGGESLDLRALRGTSQLYWEFMHYYDDGGWDVEAAAVEWEEETREEEEAWEEGPMAREPSVELTPVE